MSLQIQKSFANHESGTLFLVPTPIGNLDDMTFRSVKVLKDVDLIAAEDTRNTQKLLNHFEIETRKISLHEHNTEQRVPEIIDKLKAGSSVAQVSDAGMPSISDPGHELVEAAINNDIPVVSVPGASAGITSLISSGLKPQPFLFYGFLKRKPKEQIEELKRLSIVYPTMIFYESPHRLKKTLSNMQEVLGNRKAVLARELTKKFEEYVRGGLDDLVQWSEDNEIRGEFVILISGNPKGKEEDSSEDPMLDLSLMQQVQYLIDNGSKTNDAIKTVAKRNNKIRQDVYNQFHEIN